MPMWRCPHCGTPQAETARCWVCHRSSTACATCRNFRRSVAGVLGYCGLDRQRQPLRGDEIRACWEATTAHAEVPVATARGATTVTSTLAEERTPVRRLEFVEVRSAPATARRRKASGGTHSDSEPVATTVAGEAPVTATSGEPRWSLWGDSDG